MNSSSNENASFTDPYSACEKTAADYIIIYYCVFFPLFGFGIVLNLLTLVTLIYGRIRCKDRRSPLKTTLTILVIHLSFSDLLHWIQAIFASYFIIYVGEWYPGPITCVVFGFIRWLPEMVSIVNIGVIAVNRVMFIYCPAFTVKIFEFGHTIPILLLTWAIPIIAQFPFMIPSLGYGTYGFDSSAYWCQCKPVSYGPVDVYEIALMILLFLPMSVTIISFILILLKVRNSRKEIERFSNNYDDKRFLERERNISIIVLCMTGLFLVGSIPVLLNMYCAQYVNFGHYFDPFSDFTFYLIYCGNLFFYVFKNNCYREASKQLLIDIWFIIKRATKSTNLLPSSMSNTTKWEYKTSSTNI